MLMYLVDNITFFLTVICIGLGNLWALELIDSINTILKDPLALSHIPEDGKLNFTETATKYGYDCEEYDVTTQDGYIIKLFHIIGDKEKNVLIMHGILDSADSSVLRGNKSLAINLAKAGYNVWAGNCRGTRYSTRHNSLNSDVDVEFWNFSFHEIAMYDLPAVIDFVLDKTNQTKLDTIGHSQGTTMHFALLSEKPAYNNKINVFVALAPISFMNNAELKIVADLLKLVPIYNNELTEEFYKQGIFKDNGTLRSILEVVCTQKGIGYDVCANMLFVIFGDDPEGLERDFLPTFIGRIPTSVSIKCFVHYIQIMQRKKFLKFDYGESKNQELYGSASPPDYDLRKVSSKIALLVSKNDKLSTIPDVELLKTKLSNVVKYHVMTRDKFNHLDFIVGRFMEDELFPQIFDILKKYS